MEQLFEFDRNQIFELRCKTTCFFGYNALSKMDTILKEMIKRGHKKCIVVTSKTAYKKCGAWDACEKAFKENSVDYVVFNDFKPNPETTDVDKAFEIGKKFGATFVLAIGGGSPIDAGKAVAILLKGDVAKCANDLVELKGLDTAVPIVTINTTHGTGTEVDRFAVISDVKRHWKPALANDSIYPLFSIDDPNVTVFMNREQTIYTAVDAVNHCFEGATTTVTQPYSIMLAKEAIYLVAKYLPKALKDLNDKEARYWLLYASCIAGICFDNGLLHLTHGLEHPLSGIKPTLAHGLGLGMLLPSVVKEVYNEKPKIIIDILKPILDVHLRGVKGEEDKCAQSVERWLFSVGCTHKLIDEGFGDKVDELVKLALETPSLGLLISLSPKKMDKEGIKRIYTNSLVKMDKGAPFCVFKLVKKFFKIGLDTIRRYVFFWRKK